MILYGDTYRFYILIILGDSIFYRHTSGEAADVTTGVARGDGCVPYNERPRTHQMAA